MSGGWRVRPDGGRLGHGGRRAAAVRALALAWSVLAANACGRPAPPSANTAPVIRDAWARPAAAGADGVLYLRLVNGGRDSLALVGAQSTDAGAATLHASMQMGTGATAMVHMAPLARIVVPPGDSAVLAPLGQHVMLERLGRALGVGDSVPFALVLTRAGRTDTLRAVARVRAF